MVTTYSIGQFADVRAQLTVAAVLLFSATALVCLRFVSRAMRHSKFGLDDWFCLLALLAVYGIVAIAFAWAVLGMGVHIKYLPMDNLFVILKMLIPFQFCYGIAIASVKCSYLFFYLRIFPHAALQRMAYICMAIVLAWWVGNVLQIFLMCRPFAKNWNNALPGRCGNRPIGFTIIGALNMVTDVIIILLPLPWVRRLQMPRRAKLGLYLMFGIGLFITAVSIIRMRVLSTLNFADISYDMKQSCAWTFIETSVAVINSCIPMLRPLFSRFIQSTPKNSGADKSGGANDFSGATGSYHLRTVGGSEHHVRAPSGSKNFVRLSSEVGDSVAVEDKSVEEGWHRRDVDVESGIEVVVERHCVVVGTDDKGRRESVVGDESSQRRILHAL
ncbi:integral membrane protein [Phyllosticta capitalensis]|uniref:Integral membrane protein n=2 Tax=Phyllosticta capitalensis TaxID=121624 RepID=A0ABR1YNW4_9PEZI